MNKSEVLIATENFVREKLSGDSTGHDWWHIHRVRQLAISIGKAENADLFIVELAALLHDISDWKFSDGDVNAGPRIAHEWLIGQNVTEETVSHVCRIISEVSFKGAGVKDKITIPEGLIVQDADRLDAIGAIGIARAFAYGGSRGRSMYAPGEEPVMHKDFDEYKKSNSSTINHFYEKLLLLKDRMNTESGKQIAISRHAFLLEYLERFRNEWDGRD